MHVITGGAYNGKSAWVKDHYQLHANQDVCWISAYDKKSYPTELSHISESTIVLEGVEQWIIEWLNEDKSIDYRQKGRKLIHTWLQWEQGHPSRKLIVIGQDISKGIVPIDATMRLWRDHTGWFYQDLVEKSHRFDLIWYGMNQQLK